MADRRVALLRGINVGRAKRIAMADLRALVTDLGYENVATLLNSGNVVFTVPGKARGEVGPTLEAAIVKRLGVSARVTTLTAAELGAIVEGIPPSLAKHAATDPSRLLVTILSETKARAHLAPLAAKDWAPDALALAKRWAYLWCASGVLDSPLSKAASKALGDGATSRNWATMTKLHALASGQARR